MQKQFSHNQLDDFVGSSSCPALHKEDTKQFPVAVSENDAWIWIAYEKLFHNIHAAAIAKYLQQVEFYVQIVLQLMNNKKKNHQNLQHCSFNTPANKFQKSQNSPKLITTQLPKFKLSFQLVFSLLVVFPANGANKGACLMEIWNYTHFSPDDSISYLFWVENA